MCIRDRDSPFVQESEAEPEEVAQDEKHFENPLKDNFVADEIIAVSYTHLRAHETVLDLVCRLLLEKKKTDTPHNNQAITLKRTQTRTKHDKEMITRTTYSLYIQQTKT